MLRLVHETENVAVLIQRFERLTAFYFLLFGYWDHGSCLRGAMLL